MPADVCSADPLALAGTLLNLAKAEIKPELACGLIVPTGTSVEVITGAEVPDAADITHAIASNRTPARVAFAMFLRLDPPAIAMPQYAIGLRVDDQAHVSIWRNGRLVRDVDGSSDEGRELATRLHLFDQV